MVEWSGRRHGILSLQMKILKSCGSSTSMTAPTMKSWTADMETLEISRMRITTKMAMTCIQEEKSIGEVKFPLWGGNEPAHKRRKQNDDSDEVGCILGLDDDESDDEWYLRDRDDRFGEGGPMVIAFRGRWIVAGFSNGTLVKALLPEKFADKESSFDISSNHLTSCSLFPSDEWHQPQLECTKDDEDNEDDEDDEDDED
jgi:hypothetical protein